MTDIINVCPFHHPSVNGFVQVVARKPKFVQILRGEDFESQFFRSSESKNWAKYLVENGAGETIKKPGGASVRKHWENGRVLGFLVWSNPTQLKNRYLKYSQLSRSYSTMSQWNIAIAGGSRNRDCSCTCCKDIHLPSFWKHCTGPLPAQWLS